MGLKNVGNTCYVNSLLQAYFALPEFRSFVLAFRAPSTDEEPPALQHANSIATDKVLDPAATEAAFARASMECTCFGTTLFVARHVLTSIRARSRQAPADALWSYAPVTTQILGSLQSA